MDAPASQRRSASFSQPDSWRGASPRHLLHYVVPAGLPVGPPGADSIWRRADAFPWPDGSNAVHLAARDVKLMLVSRAPLEELGSPSCAGLEGGELLAEST